MITKDNEPIYRQADGNYIIHVNGQRYGVCDNNPAERYTIDMVEAYLLDHEDALIPEPVPPPQTEAELAARIRSQRDALMRTNVDCYNAARWEEMSESQRDEVKSYRRALLDITEQITFPESVSWPVKP